MSGKSALIIGATGAVGKNVLRELIASKEFTRVGEYGRRVTPKEKLGEGASKLEQKVIDFDRIEEEGLKEGKWDVIFLTLGVTRAAAGSAANWERIDRGYVLNAAKAAKSDDPTHDQRVVYCSTMGANADSHFLYMRSKGLTENGLADLGYKDAITFRPAYLANGERGNVSLAERLVAPTAKFLSYITSSAEIDVAVLGKSMFRAGFLGSAFLPTAVGASKTTTPAGASLTIIGNNAAQELAKAKIN